MVFDTNEDMRNNEVHLTYKQNRNIILDKTNKDLEITENGIVAALTQKETLRFCTNKPVEIQLRYKTPTGYSSASNKVTVTVDEILKGGVI